MPSPEIIDTSDSEEREALRAASRYYWRNRRVHALDIHDNGSVDGNSDGDVVAHTTRGADEGPPIKRMRLSIPETDVNSITTDERTTTPYESLYLPRDEHNPELVPPSYPVDAAGNHIEIREASRTPLQGRPRRAEAGPRILSPELGGDVCASLPPYSDEAHQVVYREDLGSDDGREVSHCNLSAADALLVQPSTAIAAEGTSPSSTPSVEPISPHMGGGKNSDALFQEVGGRSEPSPRLYASPTVSPSGRSSKPTTLVALVVHTPAASERHERTAARTASVDPLCLFTPPIQRWTSVDSPLTPSGLQLSPKTNHTYSVSPSPLALLPSPFKSGAAVPAFQAARAGSAPPSQNRSINEDAELLAAVQASEAVEARSRYSLRARQARQLNPYAYDKIQYKRQMRANPDAIVKVVSPTRERRRRSRGEGSATGSEDESQYVDVAIDEEPDEGWRARKKEKSGSVSMPGEGIHGAQDQGNRRSTSRGHRVHGEHRNNMHAAAHQGQNATMLAQQQPRWYPEVLQETFSSSSSDSEDLGVFRKPRKDKAAFHRKKRRAKPFPLLPEQAPNSQSRYSPHRSPHPPPSTGPIDIRSNDDESIPQATFRRHKSSSLPVVHSPINSSPPSRQPSSPQAPLDDADPLVDDIGDEFGSPVPAPPTSTDVEVSLHSDYEPPEGPPRLRRRSASPEEESDSDTDSSSVKLSARDRRRLRALRRMMPGVLVSKHMKQPKVPTRRMSHIPSSDSDDNALDGAQEPLHPGQSRVRRTAIPRPDVEIRGDQESSDIDMEIASALSVSTSDTSSESEMDAVRVSKPFRTAPNDPRPQDHEVITIEDDEDVEEEIGDWLAEKPVQPRKRANDGGIREGDLIDRMLSRTRVSGNRKSGRRQGKRDSGKRKHHRSSAGKVHVMIAGARRTGAARQTILPFARNDHNVPYETSSPAATNEHRMDVDKAHHDKEQALRKLKKQNNRGSLYTFSSGRGYLTSGRSHRDPINIDAEQVDVQDHRAPSARSQLIIRHDSMPLPQRRPLRPSGHVETTLEHYWDVATHMEEGRLSEHMRRTTQRNPDKDLWKQITIDMDIPFLPSGISLDPHGYIVRGCLRELVSIVSVDAEIPPATPCSMFDIQLLPDMQPHDLSLALEKVCDSARDALAQSRTRTQDECQRWQVLFNATCQHFTWAAKTCNEEDQLYLHSSVATRTARLCSFLDQPLDIIPDDDTPNLLVLEVRWFLFELTCRLRCRYLCPSGNLDGLASLEVVKALLKALWLYGFADVMALFDEEDFSGPIQASVPERVAEMWVSLIHVFATWSDRAAQTPQQPLNRASFWHVLAEVIKSEELPGQDVSDLMATEMLWRGLFSLSALSQFSVHGLTTSSLRLHACWPIVEFALQKAPLVVTAEDVKLKRRSLVKRDQYVRLLVSRCVLLRQKWGWTLDEPSLVFNKLLQIFKTRHYANLCDEPSDFPSWLRHNDLKELAKIKRSDTAWSLFLKWLVHDHAPKDGAVPEPNVMPIRLRKLLSIAMPMGAVPFTKAKPATDHELSMLYNRFTAVALAIYAEPTLANVKNRLASARRYVNFRDTDNETRRACIRGLMQLTILLRHLRLPLEDILDWLTEITNVLVDEYREVDASSVKTPALGPRRWLVICIQMVLGCVRRVIETPLMVPETTMAQYPDPALLQGPWTTRIFANDTNLTSVPSTGVEVRRLVQAFLDARTTVVPKPARPRPSAVAEESQDSQDGYGMFDLDMDDPELLAALGQPEQSSRVQGIKEKEDIVCEIMDKTISQAIYRLVCKHFADPSQDGTSPSHLEDADRWVDCWVGCAWVVVQNGRRNWSHFFLMGAQSWDLIIDPWYRHRVGMRFMYALLQHDAPAYLTYKERFVDLLMECLASSKVTMEHEYTGLLFSVDGLRHSLFQDLPIEAHEGSTEFKLSKKEFLNKRLGIIQQILANLASNLLKESAGDFSLRAENQQSITSVINMLATMQRAHQQFAADPDEQASPYRVLCKEVANALALHAPLRTNPRLTALVTWITSLS